MFSTAAYILGTTAASDPLNLAHIFGTLSIDVFLMIFLAAMALAVKDARFR